MIGVQVTGDFGPAQQRLALLAGTKGVRKAVLRGQDCVVTAILARYRNLVRSDPPTQFSDGHSYDWIGRKRGLMRDWYRWQRRLRGRFHGGQVATSSAQTLTAYGMPLEVGGVYEQFVKGYQRVSVTTRWGRPRREPKTLFVRPHRRQRQESGRGWLERSVAEVAPQSAVPTQRALAGLIERGEVPSARELRAGI